MGRTNKRDKVTSTQLSLSLPEKEKSQIKEEPEIIVCSSTNRGVIFSGVEKFEKKRQERDSEILKRVLARAEHLKK
jgi:hypothetical protein